MTVGASTLGDERAYFSNHGACVDVFAPGKSSSKHFVHSDTLTLFPVGLNILSTYKGDTEAIATLSGTSMASPHTAGMLAYLLSLYPSEKFDPSVSDDEDLIPALLQPQRTFVASSPIYAVAHASLPRWISEFLPSPRLLDAMTNAAPVPSRPKTLSPSQLKKALLALSTRGVLTDALPEGTPNLLIFNNATIA